MRSTTTAWACLLLGACGSDPADTESTTDDPTEASSDSSTAGEPDSTGSTTATPTDPDSSTSTGDSGSTEGDSSSTDGDTSSGSDGSSSDDGSSTDGDTSGAPVAECVSGEVNLAGIVGDEPLSGTYPAMGLGMGGPGLTFNLGDYGRIYQRVPLKDTGIYPDEPVFGPGYVRMPEQGPGPGTWYCSGEDSSYVTANEETIEFDLVDVGTLGVCPGTPVSGTVDVCFGAASCGGQPVVTADLEVGTIEQALTFFGASASLDKSGLEGEALAGEYDGGVVWFRAGELPATPGTHEVDLVDAYFIVPGGQPDAGAVYCAGAGSTMQYIGGSFDPDSVQLQGLSRLGTCPVDAKGEMSVCMQW